MKFIVVFVYRRMHQFMNDGQHSRNLLPRVGAAIHCALHRAFCAGQYDLIILLGLSLILRAAIAAVVTGPGYPDAAYYFDVAKIWSVDTDLPKILSSAISPLPRVWFILATFSGCRLPRLSLPHSWPYSGQVGGLPRFPLSF